MSGAGKPDDETRPADPSLDQPVGAAVVAFWEGGYRRLPLVDTGTFDVGRGEQCEVRIDHPSVSRQHLKLHVGDGVAVEDVGSFNGSRLNGIRIEPHRPMPIGPGDVVEIGTAMLVVQGVAARPAAQPVVTGREAVERLEHLIDLVAQSRINVVIVGETGTGKEVTAEAIHARSPRAAQRFVGVNCAAMPEALLEAELFGFEKGAFTGADRAKPGLLEAANGGSFFLDEVAELSAATQAKLLRVIERREVQPLGSLTPRRLDVRFIAATNKNLDELVERGSFRNDLLYRLNGISLSIPPLRERKFQIPELARTFARDAAAEHDRPPPTFGADALAALEAHDWPGNVRELKNAVERAVLLSQGASIEARHVDLGRPSVAPPPSSALGRHSLRRDYADFERTRILEALERAAGNQTEAAKLLGISRRTLMNRLDALAIPRPRKRPR